MTRRNWFSPKPSNSQASAKPTPGLGSQNSARTSRAIGTPQVTPAVSTWRRGHSTAIAAAAGSSAPATSSKAPWGFSCHMAGRCRAEMPPASHTMPCTDSRKAHASGSSA
ncbi:hypothetical protein D3C71_1385930 [compost metagenome]